MSTQNDQKQDDENEVQWIVLLSIVTPGYSLVFLWACYIIGVILSRKLMLNMIVMLCFLQIAISFSAIAGVFLFQWQRADYLHSDQIITGQRHEHDIGGVWVFFCLFLACTGLRHWLFDMKNWKVSLLVVQTLEENQFSNISPQLSCFQRAERPIFYTAILLNILLPAGMLLAYFLQQDNNWIIKMFYIIWMIAVSSSLYFLVSAYYRIKQVVVRLPSERIRKELMILQLFGSVLLIIVILLPVVKDLEEQNDLLTIMIAAACLNLFTIAVQMSQWHHILSIALKLPRFSNIIDTMKSTDTSMGSYESSLDGTNNLGSIGVTGSRLSSTIQDRSIPDDREYSEGNTLIEDSVMQRTEVTNSISSDRFEEHCILRSLTVSDASSGSHKGSLNFLYSRKSSKNRDAISLKSLSPLL